MAKARGIWERPLDTVKTGRWKDIPLLERGVEIFELKIGSAFCSKSCGFRRDHGREGFGQVRIRCAQELTPSFHEVSSPRWG